MYKWKLNPKQQRFVSSKSKNLCYWGGRGCIEGGTLIYDAETKEGIPIEVLYNEKKPIKVLSVVNGKVVKAQALIPVKYDKERLYKVNGIVATRNHKFLTKRWKKLSDLSVGESLQGFSPSPQETISEFYLSALYVSALHWFERVQGFLSYYHRVFCSCDERLHSAINTALNGFPSKADVSEHNHQSSEKDDWDISLKYNHLYLLFHRLSRNSFFPFFANHHFSFWASYIFCEVYQYILDLLQEVQRFVLRLAFVLLKAVIVLLSILYFVCRFLLAYIYNLVKRPLPHPTTEQKTMQGVEYVKKDYYYDLHVLGTNNYLAEGLFHHNCGKSLAAVLKIIELSLKYPKNYGLVGRYNFTDLRDSTLKDFFDYCPPEYYKYHKQERVAEFMNGSRIVFRGLKDVSKQNIRSLNLGFALLEQAEEIEEGLIDELAACCRRDIKNFEGKEGLPQMMYLCNPGINWIYRRFIQEAENKEDTPEWVIQHSKGQSSYELIKGSMMDNIINLKQTFIDDMLSKPKAWQNAFVYGEIDETLMSERKVFPVEYTENQVDYLHNPIRKLDDIDIYRNRESHQYQIGVDSSEGIEDSSVIKCIDKTTGEEVASWSGRIPPDLLAFKVVKMANYFYKPVVVLEINGSGFATLTKLKELGYGNIYVREEYDQRAKVMTKRLGWRTTHVTKPLLVGHFIELIADTNEEGKKKRPFAKIADRLTLEEMRTFLYSEKAHSKGMSAETGFHDDRVMAIMLAYWDVKSSKYEDPYDRVSTPKEGFVNESFHLQDIFNEPEEPSWMEL